MLYFAFDKQLPKEISLARIKEILKKCPVCAANKQKPNRPKFGGMTSRSFNQIVAIDLFETVLKGKNKHIVAHLIDIHSSYSYAEIIPSKEAIHIVDFLNSWRNRAGRAPQHLFSDRGTEFCNALLKQYCITNGTQFHTTSPYHAHSNGMCERRNGYIKARSEFVVHDLVTEGARFSFTPRYILDTVVFSINSEPTESGYTPHFIAFTQPSTPWLLQSDTNQASTWVDDPKAYHPLIADRMILQMKVSASVYSRKLMTQLVKAWKSKVYQKAHYNPGDQVVFWRADPKYKKGGYWFGPCSVISQRGKQYLLEYGGEYYGRPSQEVYSKDQLYPQDYLRLFDYEEPDEVREFDADTPVDIESPGDVEVLNQGLSDLYDRVTKKIDEESVPAEEQPEELEEVEVTVATQPSQPIVVDTGVEEPVDNLASPDTRELPSESSSSRRRRPNPLLPKPQPTPQRLSTETAASLLFGAPYIPRDDTQKNVTFKTTPEVKTFEPDQSVNQVVDRSQARNQDSLHSDIAINESQADREFLFRVEQYVSSVDLEQLKTNLDTLAESTCNDVGIMDWRPFRRPDDWYFDLIEECLAVENDTGVSSYMQPTKDQLKLHKSDFENAKRSEIQSWLDNGVFRVVENYEYQPGDNYITSRWLQNIKTDRSGKICKFKARLVVRGFQDNQLEVLKKDSPTVDRKNIRLLIQYAIDHKFDLYCGDISTAFLQGANFDEKENRTIFIKPPRDTNRLIGASDNAIWVLNKAAYGLSDAPRRFYESFKKTIVLSGMKRSLTDFGLFYARNDERTIGILVTHVDDVLFAGYPEFHDTVIKEIKNKFKFGKIACNTFDYTGSVITCNPTQGNVTVSQTHYAEKVILEKLPHKYPPEDFLERSHFEKYRSCLGRLNWLVVISRPDLSFNTNTLAQSMANPTYRDYSRLHKTVNIATTRSTTHLELVSLDTNAPRYILAFSDASHVNLASEGRYSSQTGSLIFIAIRDADQRWKGNLIDWSSRKQRRITRSTLACETLACCDTIDRALSLRDTYYNIHGKLLQVVLLVDCKSLVTTAMTTTTIAERRLQPDIGSIRELVDSGEIQIFHIPTGDMLADCLTKNMPMHSLYEALSTHRMPASIDCIEPFE